MAQRMQVRLRGIVQGVGFRPFVYNLAQRLNLAGYVLNDSSGVIAEVEGPGAAIEAFLKALECEHPPLAWIQDRSVTSLPLSGDREFRIRPSVAETGKFALISPDIATCAQCLADCTDPLNRRYGYAFTNCTNCGPRYTIIRDIPYDRPHTTMAGFTMCEECRAEYENPADRRFHAQPNACPACGPALSAEIGEKVGGSACPTGAHALAQQRGTDAFVCQPGNRSDSVSASEGPALSAPIAEAQQRLADGEILAIKGLG